MFSPIVFMSDFVVFIEYEFNKKLQSAFCGIFKHLNLKKLEQNLFLGEMATIESQNLREPELML